MSSLPVLWAGVVLCHVLRGSGYALRRVTGLFFSLFLFSGLVYAAVAEHHGGRGLFLRG